jgi:NADPH:quinone reductase-like Zn-dependent oxidoreductase
VKAVALVDFESGLELREVPSPEPADDDVLVRVEAASINRVDVLIAAGALRGMMEYEFPVVPGRDFTGTVERVGPEVTRFREGDPVLGWITSQTLHDGTWAEQVVTAESRFVVPRPAALDAIHAAALPLAGLTALAATEAVAPEPGELVLVVGAGGGVGSFAVQLAARRGATVIATAKTGEESWLAGLGAAETIDYTAGDVLPVLAARHGDGIDCLIDAATGQPDELARLATLVRDGGRVASTLGAAGADGRGLVATNVMADAADPAGIATLASLAAAGELRIPVDSTYPLERTPAAVEAFGRGKHGKIVLTVAG